MKQIILIGSLVLNGVLLTLLLIPKKKHHDPGIFVGYTSRSEPLNNAVDSVRNFVEAHGKMVRAYNISSKDMLQVMGLDTLDINHCKFDTCRAYLAMGNNENFKLYLTPVKNGRDVFLLNNYRDSATPTITRSSIVLDLIAPCPKTCDTLSPFYTLPKKL